MGAGPCVLGQGREFEFFGYQVISVLHERGIQIIAVNHDPTSVFTDRDLASRVYIEPLTMDVMERIFAAEKPDGLVQVLGDQNTLNFTIFSDRDGVLDRYGVKVFGCSPESLAKAEDREVLRKTLASISATMPAGKLVGTIEESLRAAKSLGYPVIVRPVFALKGVGGFVSYNMEETKEFAGRALKLSPVEEILVEKALLDWKEVEFEVLRDTSGESLAFASFEDIDPLGIHTGDSLSVYPFQTVPPKVTEDLRELSQAIVETLDLVGCVSIQFGYNPEGSESAVIDVSPGLTRGAALFSNVTGSRLGVVATRLVLGDRLKDALRPADISWLGHPEKSEGLSAFKMPCFPLERLLDSEMVLSASMKSMGNVLSLGTFFKEAFTKGFSSQQSRDTALIHETNLREAVHHLAIPSPRRALYMREAFRQGLDIGEVHELTHIDPLYLEHIRDMARDESGMRQTSEKPLDQRGDDRISSILLKAKTQGYCDTELAKLFGTSDKEVLGLREKLGIFPRVRTAGGVVREKLGTSRVYLTYEGTETQPIKKEKGRKRYVVLGGGSMDPAGNAEIDNACAMALRAIREENHDVVLLDNCPEALRSCDGLFDRAYVEPLSRESLAHILSREAPDGVITQFGGETSLAWSSFVEKAGFTLLGTPATSIQTIRDPDLETRFLDKLGLTSPVIKFITQADEVLVKSRTVGFPMVVTGMTEAGTTLSIVVHDEGGVTRFTASGVIVSPATPVILRKFSEHAVRLEVAALSDGTRVFVGPVIEYIEGTMVSPVDSACILPSLTTDPETVEEIRTHTTNIARELHILGFLNVQFWSREEELGILEIDPRASHAVAFTSRALGIPLAKIGAKLLLGRKLEEFGLDHEIQPRHIAVKEAALPFDRFPGIDPVLGPQSKSTGEVMGIGDTFGAAFAKSQISVGLPLPSSGKAFVSVRNRDKRSIIFIASKLLDLGFSLIATEGTAKVLSRHGLEVESVYKIAEGRPDVVDLIKNGDIHLIINTPTGERPRKDLMEIRSQAVASRVPCITTISKASAAVFGIQDFKRASLEPRGLHDD
jgi:carbamoyl-phosphate synthase large subunit